MIDRFISRDIQKYIGLGVLLPLITLAATGDWEDSSGGPGVTDGRYRGTYITSGGVSTTRYFSASEGCSSSIEVPAGHGQTVIASQTGCIYEAR